MMYSQWIGTQKIWHLPQFHSKHTGLTQATYSMCALWTANKASIHSTSKVVLVYNIHSYTQSSVHVACCCCFIKWCHKEVVWGNKVGDQKGERSRKLGVEVKKRKKGKEDPLFKDLQKKRACLCGLGSWLEAQNYPH